MGAVPLISDGSIMLIKYKLNNMCDPKGIRKPNQGGAQIIEQFLYTTIYCGCQYGDVEIMCFEKVQSKTQYALSPY